MALHLEHATKVGRRKPSSAGSKSSYCAKDVHAWAKAQGVEGRSAVGFRGTSSSGTRGELGVLVAQERTPSSDISEEFSLYGAAAAALRRCPAPRPQAGGDEGRQAAVPIAIRRL